MASRWQVQKLDTFGGMAALVAVGFESHVIQRCELPLWRSMVRLRA